MAASLPLNGVADASVLGGRGVLQLDAMREQHSRLLHRCSTIVDCAGDITCADVQSSPQNDNVPHNLKEKQRHFQREQPVASSQHVRDDHQDDIFHSVDSTCNVAAADMKPAIERNAMEQLTASIADEAECEPAPTTTANDQQQQQQQQLPATRNQRPLSMGRKFVTGSLDAIDDAALESVTATTHAVNEDKDDDDLQNDPIDQRQILDIVMTDLSQLKEYLIDQIVNLEDHDSPSIERQPILEVFLNALAHLSGTIDTAQGGT